MATTAASPGCARRELRSAAPRAPRHRLRGVPRARLERVLFVPAAAPPHKDGGARTPAAVRLELTSLAIDDDLRFTASGIEIERGLVYTVDTLRALGRRYAGHDLVFIMGSDSLLQLEAWHEPDELLSLCTLAVAPRPGDPPAAIAAAAERWGADRVVLLDVPALDRLVVGHPGARGAGPAHPLSGAAPGRAVHPGVGALPVTGIDRASAEALIAERLSPRRREHSHRVAAEAVALARALRRLRRAGRDRRPAARLLPRTRR